MITRSAWPWLLALFVCACGSAHGSGAAESTTTLKSEEAHSGAPAAFQAPATRQMSPPLPERVDAGTIPRPALAVVLQAGPARLLARVQVEPERDDGAFVGWRLLELFADDPPLRARSILRAGDVLLRINGQAIERPEQFMAVWESLASSTEIVFEIMRGDQPSKVRYLVAGDAS